MTHDELLADINGYDAFTYDPNERIINALRAVVRLHYPIAGYCNRCSVNNWGEKQQKYPCDEIQAIEKELG